MIWKTDGLFSLLCPTELGGDDDEVTELCEITHMSEECILLLEICICKAMVWRLPWRKSTLACVFIL